MKTNERGEPLKVTHCLAPEKRVELDVEIEGGIVGMIEELAEEASGLTLAKLRQKLGLTQLQVADKMGYGKDYSNVSHFEIRDNHKVSMLRKYVAALGGELELIVRVGNKTFRLKV